MKSKERIEIGVLIAAFLTTSTSIIFFWEKPSVGYEISIYSTDLIIGWMLVVFGLSIGTCIVVSNISRKEEKRKLIFPSAFLVILINTLVVLLLPCIRGYALYGREDVLGHLGYVKDIHIGGHFSRENFYPVTHILLFSMGAVGDISFDKLAMCVPPLFLILFVSSSFLLGRFVWTHSRYVYLVLISSCVLFLGAYHISIVPNGLSLMMAPIVAYLYLKSISEKSLGRNILLVIVILLYPFFHPLTSVILLSTFVGIELSWYTYDEMTKRESSRLWSTWRRIRTSGVTFYRALILMVALITWISSYYVWSGTIKRLAQWVSGEMYSSPGTELFQTLEEMDLGLFLMVRVVFISYGPTIVYLALSLGLCIVLQGSLLASRDDPSKKRFLNGGQCVRKKIFVLCAIFGASLLMAFLLYVVPVGVDIFRPLRPVVLVAPPLGGYALFTLLSKQKYRKAHEHSISSLPRVVGVCALIVLPLILGVFAVYPSPLIMQPNSQVTLSEFEGFEWFFEYKDKDLHTSYIATRDFRFGSALLGHDVTGEREDIQYRWSDPRVVLPDHFGYERNTSLGNAFLEDRYVILSRFDLLLYTDVWPTGRFNETDYVRLRLDHTICEIYSSDGFRILLVRTIR